jgi:hypothetical protein
MFSRIWLTCLSIINLLKTRKGTGLAHHVYNAENIEGKKPNGKGLPKHRHNTHSHSRYD